MTRGISFHPQDDFGLFPGGQKYPYVSIVLTKEQVEAIKGKVAGIYEIEGKQTFKLKKDTFTGEEVLYVVWI